MNGNDGIGKEGTCQLIVAQTVDPPIPRWLFGARGLQRNLALPERCEKYASQCEVYHKVKERIIFSQKGQYSFYSHFGEDCRNNTHVHH